MAKRVLTIKKEKGVIANLNEIISTITLWLAELMNGNWVLTIERSKAPRSSEQNRLMWLWFQAIADNWSEATGKVITRQMVHDAYCMLFLPIDTPKGTIAGSTSGLTTEQMTEFLNQVQVDAASEYGIQLPNPDDYNFELWAKTHSY